jgi:hypothetical protein
MVPAIPNSILDSTKKMLGLDADYNIFDLDVITHINSVFSTLTQLGVGRDDGFQIEDSEALWSDFLGANKLVNNVKTLMYLKVRLLFDPPTLSFDLSAKQEQIRELEWRINVAVDKGTLSETNVGGAFLWELEADNVFPPEAERGDLGIYPISGNVWRKS